MGDDIATADFSGYATKANLKCSDGRTIAPDAFKHQDKVKVPLVWQHAHNEPANVLGHAILENRDDGVYCYGFFNNTPTGQNAKDLVEHDDVNSLSIYANRLVEKAADRSNKLKTVVHGMIREVSLVIAGANPGALIEQVAVRHADGSYEELEDEAIIFSNLPLEHADPVDEDTEEDEEQDEEEPEEDSSEEPEGEEEGDNVAAHAAAPKAPPTGTKTVQDVFDTLSADQKNIVYYLISQALGGSDAADPAAAHSEAEVGETFASMSEEQQKAAYFMVSEALEQSKSDAAAHADQEPESEASADEDQEGTTMVHNVFEGTEEKGKVATGTSLSHADQEKIFKRAARLGSLKDALQEFVEDDTLSHGIEDIDTLFPDAKAITSTPDFIARRQEWVNAVMSGTRHTPFSRIKSLTANLTFEEARAKGYVKGNLKKEEFFPVAKRVTTPQTVYKKQKLDRDDVLDITDFDVVAWLKGEMRLMLEEEIARAILIGDGRDPSDEDKINETNIRPIASDDELFVTKLYAQFDPEANPADNQDAASALIDQLTLNRRYYRGSGNPTMFCGEGTLAQLLLLKDGFGRRVYNTVADLQAAIRVSSIQTVEVMDETANNVLAVIVNLQDYNVGADRGGDVALFDDFDIDYNQYKYLIETRISGALVKAKSALVLLKAASGATLVDPVAPAWDGTAHTVTVATTAGVTYKNKLSNTTLTTAAPVTLAEGEQLQVIAVPADSSHYFASSANDQWLYDYDNGREDGIL